MSYFHIIYTIYISFLVLTCIVVTSQLRKYKHTPLILAPVILWLSCISELVGFLYGTYVTYDNGWIYNITDILFFSAFYLMMYRYLRKASTKKVTLVLSVGAIAFYLIRLFTVSSMNVRLSTAHCIAVFVLMIVCALYLTQLIRSNLSIHIRNHPEFFFIGGFLIINLVYAPIYVASDLNLRIFSESFYTYVSSIHSYVYIAVNLLFIFGFVWTKKSAPILDTKRE